MDSPALLDPGFCLPLVRTLAHFLWQGAVIAALAAAATCWLRRAPARIRYRMYVTALLLMAACLPTTAVLLQVGDRAWPTASTGESARGVEAEPDVRPLPAAHVSPPYPDASADPSTSASAEAATAATDVETVRSRWQDLAPYIVVAYCTGAAIMLIRLLGSLWSGHRLLRDVRPLKSLELTQLISRQSRMLGLKMLPKVGYCARIAVPVVVGIVRPTLLLPLSMATGLTSEQVKIILLHELVHVRRYDHVVNFLQRIIESVLFFHPAVWYVSRCIHVEREHCCDDAVLAAGAKPLTYARTLVRLAELALDDPRGKAAHPIVSAAAFGRQPSWLRGRIVRMLGDREDSRVRLTRVGAFGFLGALLLAAALGVATISNATIANRSNTLTAVQIEEVPIGFRMLDGFEGKLELDWKPVRPDPTHVSLTRNPGKLTITTQPGSIYGNERELDPGVPAKNLYLIRSPAAEEGDFVATTCIESFHPEVPYQQAGLLVYNDDDNYLKWEMEHARYSPALVFIRETDQEVDSTYYSIPGGPDVDRFWLRLAKRGQWYEYSYSTDGKEYTVFGEKRWGTGVARWLGVLAKNGAALDEIDAVFDFFEVRSLTSAEKNDPRLPERQKLQGAWEVVSRQSSGKLLQEPPLSWFAFVGSEVTISEGEQSIPARYAVDVTDERKELVLFGLSSQSREAVRALYRLEDDTLSLCFDPRPGSPAPTELESNDGDGRMLVTLRRMSPAKAAALERNSQPAQKHFEQLDKDQDDFLTPDEFTADRPTPEAVKQGADLFKLLDRDGDGKLTLDELKSKPRQAVYLQMDLNADGVLTVEEFSVGEMKSARADRARRVFELVDKDHDGMMSLAEFRARTPEAWFVKLDTSEDDRLTYSEYAAGNQALVENDRCRAVFAAIDRNGDGCLDLDEFQKKSAEALFAKQDINGDDKLTLEEFNVWKQTPEQTAAAKKGFAQKDGDGDGLLNFKEYAYQPGDADFWNADQDGDNRLSLDEFRASRPAEASDKLQARFRATDENSDGHLSLAEFKARPASD